MRPAEIIDGLAAHEHRGAGSDAERRAAKWLATQVRQPGHKREADIEPFWCRPNWALAHAWHVLLGIAGSLASVASPRVGGALIVAAIVSVIADERLGLSPGRRLTPERASQNVVSSANPDDERVRLILTANYDAGRTGVAYRVPRPGSHRMTPGWLGWLVVVLAWGLATALLRLNGSDGTAVGIAQLIPTAALVIALALLLELAGAGFGPSANDNATGVAVALALAASVDVAPPRNLAVELVLQGAGDGFGLGLRAYLRKHHGELSASNTVVLGIAPCGAGEPQWWISDGQLVPLRYFKGLQELCAQTWRELDDERSGHRGRGATPALPARSRRLPAITIGCLDEQGHAPRSHTAKDISEAIDQATLDQTLEHALILIDAIDSYIGRRASRASSENLTPA